MQWMLSVQILLLLLLPHGCKWMNVSSGTGSPRQRQLNSCACVRARVCVHGKTCQLLTKRSGVEGCNSIKAHALSLFNTGSNNSSTATGSSIKTAVKDHKI